MTQSMTVLGDGPNVAQDSRIIPIADAPVQPVLSVAGLLGQGKPSLPSLLDAREPVFVTAGRIAIALGLELTGVGPGDRVLVPAFHCASMISPLSWVSATPDFYRIGEDLLVDLADIERRIGPDTKAVLAPHYFGFHQNMAALRKLCDTHRLLLIEDCAHAFFGALDQRPIGSFGDFAIGSLTKFFPVRDGGCLLLNRSVANLPEQRRQSRWQDLRALFDSLEDANYYGRMAAIGPAIAAVKAARRALAGSDSSDGMDQNEEDKSAINPAQLRSGAQDEFHGAWIHVRPTRMSEWLSRRSVGQRIVERRIRHFRHLAESFASLASCRPLFTAVPQGVVPHMFPLYVDNLPRVFPLLEDLAVPVQRFGQFLWTGVDETTCPVSADLSHHLIQLPCHQDLTDEEIVWIVDRVTDAMGH